MNNEIRIERLTEENFGDYESLTSCENDGGCYCAFWHQKWASMDEWNKRQKEEPLKNRETILDRVRSHFHVGALAYRGADLIAWISVGPLIDCYWAWRRSIQVGLDAKTIAGITCITIAPRFRGQKFQALILEALKEYGKKQGWTAIEGYPFDKTAFEKHGPQVAWPGYMTGFSDAGFVRVSPHWLSSPDWERSIYSLQIS